MEHEFDEREGVSYGAPIRYRVCRHCGALPGYSGDTCPEGTIRAAVQDSFGNRVREAVTESAFDRLDRKFRGGRA